MWAGLVADDRFGPVFGVLLFQVINVFVGGSCSALGSVDDPSVYLAFLETGGQVGVVSYSGVNW